MFSRNIHLFSSHLYKYKTTKQVSKVFHHVRNNSFEKPFFIQSCFQGFPKRTITTMKSGKKGEFKIQPHYLFMGSLLFMSSLIPFFRTEKMIENSSIGKLKEYNDIEKITIIDEKTAMIKRRYIDTIYKVEIPGVEYLEKKLNKNEIPTEFIKTKNWGEIFGTILSLLIMFVIFFSMSRNMSGLTNLMEMNKAIQVKSDIGVGFKDVVGQKNALQSVSEFVDILKNREKYEKIGVKIPKGALLSGPPGTGKTLLAKAIAGESNLPFIDMSGSDFNAMFVGVGSAKIKNLFKKARLTAKEHGGCILFIDEIDAMGQKRSANQFGGNSERENTLNQLLTEMDGFEQNENVMTFAATNRPELLDPALLRPGRFDRKILVDLPTLEDRKKLFAYYFQKLKVKNEQASVETCGKLTAGFSGADIANVVNEAGIITVRKKEDQVSEMNIKEAIDYVNMGNEKENIMTKTEANIVAYHEAGHAYFSYILPLVENPIKVSIVPREKGMLGFSQSEYVQQSLVSKKKLEQYMIVLMAGRACEQIFCHDVTNGAANDIQKATEIAKQYVQTFGFTSKNKFMSLSENNNFKNEYSPIFKSNLDAEILNLLNEKYNETLNLVKENKENIENIRNVLYEKKNIYLTDIEASIEQENISFKNW